LTVRTYQLRKLTRPAAGTIEPTKATKGIEARNEREAVAVAQALAAEPDDILLAIEVRASDQRVLWSLGLGPIASPPPDEVP
jgi:hypothetical protein